jgi:cell wall-associated NlpC family hydrolase
MTAKIVTAPILRAHVHGPRPRLDPRSHIATAEIVDIGLAGSVAAARYVAPLALTCGVAQTPIRAAGSVAATAVSELLWGEGFDLFDVVGDWGFGRSCHDRYTGWVAMAALTDRAAAPTRAVTARVAPLFAHADIKAPVLALLPFGARVSGAVDGKFLAVTGGGYLHLRHLAPPPPTPIEVARLFSGAPYVWGGRTPIGVDCSGLVQAGLAACGIACPRDSDQQRETLGTAVDFADRRGGDIIFFPGHVGILVDANTLLHANAHWMAVVEEPLADVIGRLADAPHPVTGVRRIG